MNCPYCQFEFKVFASSAPGELPTLAPVLCEDCGKIGLLINGLIRKVTDEELKRIKKSPAYREMIHPVQQRIQERKRISSTFQIKD